MNSTIPGDIVKYGDLYHFRPYGWAIWFFWSGLHNIWIRCNEDRIENYWHRHVPGRVDISKLMVK